MSDTRELVITSTTPNGTVATLKPMPETVDTSGDVWRVDWRTNEEWVCIGVDNAGYGATPRIRLVIKITQIVEIQEA